MAQKHRVYEFAPAVRVYLAHPKRQARDHLSEPIPCRFRAAAPDKGELDPLGLGVDQVQGPEERFFATAAVRHAVELEDPGLAVLNATRRTGRDRGFDAVVPRGAVAVPHMGPWIFAEQPGERGLARPQKLIPGDRGERAVKLLPVRQKARQCARSRKSQGVLISYSF